MPVLGPNIALGAHARGKGGGGVALPVIASVSISGTPREGQTLTATVDATGADSIAYAWYRDGVAISGATASTYLLVEADGWNKITVEATATNGGGSAALESDPTEIVTPLYCLAWWNADRSDLMTLSGAQISGWADVVGGYNPTQGVAGARPLYSSTSFNGAPGATFDGLDDELTLASTPLPTGGTGSTIWVLTQQDLLAAETPFARRAFSYGGTTADTNRRIGRTVTAGVNRAVMGVDVSGVSGINVDLSGRHILTGVITSTGMSLLVDDVAEGSASEVPNTGTTRTRIGANTNNTPTEFWKGIHRDIIVTSAGTTSGQDDAVLAFLNSRKT